MFLVTTADQRHWKTDEEIVFLGEWCRLYSQKNIWSKLDHRVLPYHWDDRKRLYEDSLYLQSVYEKYLEQLTTRLNILHGKTYSGRYWRILIGPWLTYFIPVFYDAYRSIKVAEESGMITNTWLSDTSPGRYLPNDAEATLSWVLSDESYHHYLYSWVIKSRGKIPFEVNQTHYSQSALQAKKTDLAINRVKRAIKNCFGWYAKFLPESVNKIFFANNYFSFVNYIKLQLSLGQIPTPFCLNITSCSIPMNTKLREGLNQLPEGDDFQVLLSKIVPEQIPTVYLEGYLDMHERSLAAFPRRSKVILSGVEIYLNEGFKFWAADQADRSSELLGAQHGGGYGSSLITWLEDHEKKIFDRFFSWGWSEKINPAIAPLSSPQLSRQNKKIKPDPGGGILWIEISLAPRYLYVMYSGCLGPQVLEYIKDQERFAEAVSVEVFGLLILRLYPRDSGWDVKKRWADNYPSLNIYQGSKPLARQLNECRLCVQTYNSTTLLETLAANFPTIIFLNPNHWELRKSVQPFFSELRRVGLLHDTPESAASKVNEIYEDPMSWWMSDKVQEVKNEFCHRFARTSEAWLQEWKIELSKLNGD